MTNLEKAIIGARKAPKLNVERKRLADPTRTGKLQKAFAKEAIRRLNELQKVLLASVKTNNAFSLKTNQHAVITPQERVLNPQQFQFASDPQKIADFEAYTEEMIAAIYLLSRTTGLRFSDPFISKAVETGSKRAQTEWKKEGGTVEEAARLGPLALINPVSDGEAIVKKRASVTIQQTGQKLQNRLTFAFASGVQANETPAQVGERIVNAIGVTKREVDTVARTEIVRAFNIGNINELESLGVTEVRVLAEWTTAGDGRVCPECSSMEGLVFSLDAMRDLIPLHPRCRCIALPVLNPVGRADTVTPEAAQLLLNKEKTAKPDPVTVNLVQPKESRRSSTADLTDMIRAVVLDELMKNAENLTANQKRGPRGFAGNSGDKGDKGARGYDGKTGDRGPRGFYGAKGPKGLTGNQGEKGDCGPIGPSGEQGKRGRIGPRGMRGAEGQKGKQGRTGKIPDHEYRLNKAGTHEIRFEKPNGKFGDWVSLSGFKANEVFSGPNGMQAYEYSGGSIRFRIDNKWNPWIPLGGGGGGGGGLSTVETDETISGDGSEAAPLRNYGIVNRVIDQDLVVGDGQVMINHNILLDDGVTISTEGDGSIYLV